MRVVLTLTILTFSLTGCGNQKTSSTVFEKASDQCASQTISNRYIVRYVDGSLDVVHADSDQELMDGFLTDNLDRIAYAEPDYEIRVRAEVNAEATTQSMADNWGVERVGAAALWQQNVRGTGVPVAVVDSGMDITHPQLRDQILTNAGEIGTDRGGNDRATNGVDDDLNGYVDDAYGYDFVKNRGLQGDYNAHGTHVAGVVAARHNDTEAQYATYVQGVAPAAKILPLAFLNEQGSGAMSNGVRAIEYAVKRGVRVINASWGGTQCSKALRDVIASLEQKNVIFVAAAGNDGVNVETYKEYPASLDLPAQITVGATGDLDYMAHYSNWGPRAVHIFAPGTAIISTIPGGVGGMSGTSMATPFVTGAVALLLSAEPQATVTHIRQALYTSAFHRGDYLNASQGRMDLRTALTELRRLMGH